MTPRAPDGGSPVIRGGVAAYSIHLAMVLFLFVFSVVGYVTSAGGAQLPFIGLGVVALSLLAVGSAGASRSQLLLSSDKGMVATNALRTYRVEAESIQRIEICDRWWYYLSYGPIGAFEAATPTARVITDKGRFWVTALAPLSQSSDDWSEVLEWASRLDVDLSWS